jgi:hypothetical protein
MRIRAIFVIGYLIILSSKIQIFKETSIVIHVIHPSPTTEYNLDDYNINMGWDQKSPTNSMKSSN